jgi:hypothetical protein
MFIVVMWIEPLSEWLYVGTADGSLTIANLRNRDHAKDWDPSLFGLSQSNLVM